MGERISFKTNGTATLARFAPPGMRWRAALVVLAVGAALVPISPAAVERLYSNGLYAVVQRAITSASNLAPVAGFDVAIAVAAILWIVLAVRDIGARGGSALRGAGRVVLRTVIWSAAVYLLFLLAWGLNYRRVRLADRLEFNAAAVTADAARTMANVAVDHVNALYEPAHAAGWGPADAIDPGLAAAFARAVREVGGPAAVAVARPKRTMLDWYFRRAAVSGMTDPFFLETLIASDVLPFERPFVVAHEWSHLAGLADEGEANFLGWLTCLHGSTSDRYSGWLFFYQEVLTSVAREDRPVITAKLAAGPRDDLRASHDRLLRNVSPRVSALGWRVYDSYLKANRVEAGAASYAEVVRLVLGVRFADDWRPVLRPQGPRRRVGGRPSGRPDDVGRSKDGPLQKRRRGAHSRVAAIVLVIHALEKQP